MITRLRQVLLLAFTIAALLATSSRLPADTGTCGGGDDDAALHRCCGECILLPDCRGIVTPALPTGRLRQLTARATTLPESRWRRSSRGLRTRRCGGAAVGQLSSNGPLPLGNSMRSIPLVSGQLIKSDGRGRLWFNDTRQFRSICLGRLQHYRCFILRPRCVGGAMGVKRSFHHH